MLFTGGPIITFGRNVEGAAPTSLAIDGDRIVAIGDSATSWAASFDEVVQLDGRALVPAFRDGHAHPLHAGINRNSLDLTGVRPLEKVIERVRQWADAHPEDPWIVGHCYDPTILPRGVGRGRVARRHLQRPSSSAASRPTITRCGQTARRLPLPT